MELSVGKTLPAVVLRVPAEYPSGQVQYTLDSLFCKSFPEMKVLY